METVLHSCKIFMCFLLKINSYMKAVRNMQRVIISGYFCMACEGRAVSSRLSLGRDVGQIPSFRGQSQFHRTSQSTSLKLWGWLEVSVTLL